MLYGIVGDGTHAVTDSPAAAYAKRVM